MKQEEFVIVIPIYHGVDLMDIAAPREIFSWANTDARKIVLYFVGEASKNGKKLLPVKTRDGLTLYPDASFEDKRVQKPNLIWVPGGNPADLRRMLDEKNNPFLKYTKKVGRKADWVCSVCEGAILLADTGLLDGYEITTHHAFYPCMAAFPKVKLVDGYPRYVKDGNRITGGGISSGLDQAFFIVELIQGTGTALNVQSTMQYYPDPPVNGSITPSSCCPVEGMIPVTPECELADESADVQRNEKS